MPISTVREDFPVAFRTRRVLGAGLAALALSLLTSDSLAQTVLSETTWGGVGADGTEGTAVASDGSSYLTGFTFSFGEQTRDIFLVKFAADGSLVWQVRYSGTVSFSIDESRDVAVAPDGSVYVTGSTLGFGNEILLLKFSPDGTLVWQRTLGGSGGDVGEALAVGADGSVYVVGSTRLSDPDAADLIVAKFTPSGDLVWQKTWGLLAGFFEEGEGVDVGPDGNIYVSGVAPRPDVTFEHDTVLLKIDPSGVLLWQNAYSAGGGTDSRGGLAASSDGSLYVAGALFDERTFDLNALLLKVTPDGGLVWDRSWGGRSGDDASDVAVAPNGTVILVGQTNSFAVGSDDAFFVEVLPDAKVSSAGTWGSPLLDRGAGVDVGPDGTVSLGATTESPPPYVLGRAPSKMSRVKGSIRATTVPFVNGTGVVSVPTGVVSPGEGVTTFAGDFDAALVRLTTPGPSAPVMVEPDDADVTSGMAETRLLQNRPNPFLGSTEVSFRLGQEEIVSLQVLDLNGRVVKILESGTLPAGEHTVVWDGSDHLGRQVAAGLYFYRLASSSGDQIGKMILVR